MAGVWFQRALRTVAPAARASQGRAMAAMSMPPRGGRGMCAPTASPTAPSPEEDFLPPQSEGTARDGHLTEVLRRMLSMDNACQGERNKLRILEAMKEHQRHESDTGSPEAQIAIFTERINYLQGHVKQHHKDQSTKRGVNQLVSDRKKMLKYLKRKDEARYHDLIQKLGLRDVISLVPTKSFLPAKAAQAADLKIRMRQQEKENLEKGLVKNKAKAKAYAAKKSRADRAALPDAPP
eukprot:CAMPEP_0206245542 /NCGR_PEP_ID=MMETSP0047_2-20121206/18753_1 /ASSEMBLY_ACC=CAM_ASM_000192 /TAXON_ID=195065 /ORGANISM="Chroomonas mesostigmatica_cf, Strain CCMP1168" /LENGTH=236 /DNA_ID=CAMNT_0053670849 /DNA_START=31 /DNA_END=741 /DNA_ORIENTATION=+